LPQLLLVVGLRRVEELAGSGRGLSALAAAGFRCRFFASGAGSSAVPLVADVFRGADFRFDVACLISAVSLVSSVLATCGV
jgi:hypothetical protein